MAVATLSIEAEADLERIVVEIAKHNPQAATRWHRKIWARFDMLARQPYAGSEARIRVMSLRCLPFGMYVIYYSMTENGIQVVRVVHGARLQDLFD